jgi:hypothetical protein
VVIVVILPLFELRVEEVNVVGDAVAIEELVELLVVDPVATTDAGQANAGRRPSLVAGGRTFLTSTGGQAG